MTLMVGISGQGKTHYKVSLKRRRRRLTGEQLIINLTDDAGQVEIILGDKDSSPTVLLVQP